MREFGGGEPNIPARWAMGSSGKSKRHYIEGSLQNALDVGSTATLELDFPIGSQTTVQVAGHWFSAPKYARVGAEWYSDLEMYVAIAKLCPDSPPGTDNPPPYSGDLTSSGGGGDPGIDPGPPPECTTNWCAYHWDGSVWVFVDHVGCDTCPALPDDTTPPEPGQPWYRYQCCVIAP